MFATTLTHDLSLLCTLLWYYREASDHSQISGWCFYGSLICEKDKIEEIIDATRMPSPLP
jgi:hypothetical protein